MHRFPLSRLLILLASASLAACSGSNSTVLTVPVSAANAFLLTSDNTIVGVDVDDMEFARSVRSLPQATGASIPGALDATEVVLDIDYRNSEGALYALTKTGTTGRIIRIDPTSGALARISTLVSDGTTSNMSLSATGYTIDFNPVVDRLRIIGTDGSNWRTDVSTGDTLVDTATSLTNLSGAGYEETFSALGRGTRLFTLDAATDNLYLQTPPNDGTQTAAKSLLGSTDVASIDGYDINPANNAGLAMLTVAGVQRIYTINPAASIGSNAASLVGRPPVLTGPLKYKALTFITRANPTVLALTSNNSYRSFNANTPDQVSDPVTITGLTATEKVIGIDFSQSARKLYALTDTSNVYAIDLSLPVTSGATPAGGAAASVSTLKTPLTTDITYTTDFNPFVGTAPNPNQLRLIGSNNENSAVTVEDGTVVSNGPVSGTPTPLVKAAAYVNNFRGTTATSLLVIDQASSSLNVQNISSEPGKLTRLAALGIMLDPGSPVGFDISGRNNENQLLMARTASAGAFTLYRVNSAATSTPLTVIGPISGTTDLIDIAIPF
ncbi:MAG: DUF4394 domain-containing protein [Pseudomonadota bacterium]